MRLDTSAPTVALGSPTSGGSYATGTSVLTVSGTATDNVGVTQVAWSNDRGGSGTASGTTSWKASSIQLSAGTNTLTFTARDAAGNHSSKTLMVTYNAPDTSAPTVALSSPTSGGSYATGTSALTVSGTAADNVGVTQVAWSNDRGGSGTASGTASWKASSIQLSAGTNTLTFTARDAAGNHSSKTLVVTYNAPDTSAPTVSLSTPTSGGSYATESAAMMVTGTATDNVGVTQVAWSNDRGGSGTASGTGSWTAGSIALHEGVNNLTFTAEDKAGNQGSKTLAVTYTVPVQASSDQVAPAVRIVSPPAGQTIFRGFEALIWPERLSTIPRWRKSPGRIHVVKRVPPLERKTGPSPGSRWTAGSIRSPSPPTTLQATPTRRVSGFSAGVENAKNPGRRRPPGFLAF